MTTTPALKLAILNDIHVGGPEGGGFQNTFLTADSDSLLAPTIAAINRTAPDLTLIPGDLTHNATVEQLSRVCAHLNDLDSPFLACKGNHDRETPEAAECFERMIGSPGKPGIRTGPELNLPDGVAVLVLESSWTMEGEPYVPDAPPLAVPDAELVETALAGLDGLRPDWLLVLSHYPLVSEAEYVRSQSGRYAGHVRGGSSLLQELTGRAGAVVCFCGHNHYHHIASGDRWLQCATAALAEYPAEFRSATISDGQITISTATGAESLLQSASPPDFPWVQGRPQDRELTWRPA